MSNISIETTQNVAIEYKAANVLERSAAFIIDYILLLVGAITAFFVFYLFIDVVTTLPPFIELALGIILFLALIFYFPASEILLNGQTFGKRALKIRVVKLDGSPATAGSYFIRWLLGIVEISLTFGSVAFLAVIITKQSQRLGDLVAGTTVVHLSKPITLDSLQHHISTVVEPSITLTYPTVVKLSQNDIIIIRKLLQAVHSNTSNPEAVVNALWEAKLKVEGIIGITSEQQPLVFLTTVVQDYNSLQK